jgi:hypothetical protein
MAEHCALYPLCPGLPSLEQLASLVPGTQVSVVAKAPDSSWSVVELRWPQASLQLTRMDLGDTTFHAHLSGLVTGFTSRFRGNLDLRASALLERLTRSKHVFGGTALPDLEKDPRPAQALRALATLRHAVIVQGPLVLDATGRAVLKDDLGSDPDAVLWVSEDALGRKQRTEQRLGTMGVPVQRAEPPLDGIEEVFVRSAPEVALRAQVLWVCALRGEGLPSDSAVEMLTRVGLWDAATAKEQTFLKALSPSQEELSGYTWGYESLWILLWALGHVPTLYSPTTVSDVGFASRLLSETPVNAFVERASLRSTSDLLDEADFHHRLFASAQAAARQGQSIPAGLHSDVLIERQRAFRWLFRHWKGSWAELA